MAVCKIVDYIYHEHLAHHSIKPLNRFFESLDMKIIDVENINTKGGSIRCYVAHKESNWAISENIAKFIDEENKAGLYQVETYIELKNDMNEIAEQVIHYLSQVKSDNKSIVSYGASATTTVLNQIYNINKYFSYIVDDNPKRQERVSPGAKLIVRSSAYMISDNPNVVFIAAWRFSEIIINKNKEYLNNGGIFVIPLPKFRIISKS